MRTRKKKYGPALYMELPSYKRKARIEAKRKAIAKKRKPIQACTPSRAKEKREYNTKTVPQVLREEPLCKCSGIYYDEGEPFVFCSSLPHRSTQVHHKHGKIGELLNWRPGLMAVCDAGQVGIHSKPKAAKAAGFIVTPWNHFPKNV